MARFWRQGGTIIWSISGMRGGTRQGGQRGNIMLLSRWVGLVEGDALDSAR